MIGYLLQKTGGHRICLLGNKMMAAALAHATLDHKRIVAGYEMFINDHLCSCSSFSFNYDSYIFDT